MKLDEVKTVQTNLQSTVDVETRVIQDTQQMLMGEILALKQEKKLIDGTQSEQDSTRFQIPCAKEESTSIIEVIFRFFGKISECSGINSME